jgi:hypothetical protein
LNSNNPLAGKLERENDPTGESFPANVIQASHRLSSGSSDNDKDFFK